MLRINGTPMLEIIIEQYKKEGFRKFLLSVNYLKEKIMDYFGTGEKLGVNIDYIVESRPLGTAGSLGLIKESIDEPLLVINEMCYLQLVVGPYTQSCRKRCKRNYMCKRSRNEYKFWCRRRRDGYAKKHR